VDEAPPPSLLLRMLSKVAGLSFNRFGGITLGYGIIFRREHFGRQILAHECRHVYQYERMGIGRFLDEYLRQVLTPVTNTRRSKLMLAPPPRVLTHQPAPDLARTAVNSETRPVSTGPSTRKTKATKRQNPTKIISFRGHFAGRAGQKRSASRTARMKCQVIGVWSQLFCLRKIRFVSHFARLHGNSSSRLR